MKYLSRVLLTETAIKNIIMKNFMPDLLIVGIIGLMLRLM